MDGRLASAATGAVTIRRHIAGLDVAAAEDELALLREQNLRQERELLAARERLDQAKAQQERLSADNSRLAAKARSAESLRANLVAMRRQMDGQVAEHERQLQRLSANPALHAPLTPAIRRRAASQPAPETPDAQSGALRRRLKELEAENLELRRAAAGVTPVGRECSPPSVVGRRRRVADPADPNCRGCSALKSQKARQATYWEGRVLSSRATEAEYRRLCDSLSLQLERLSSEVAAVEARWTRRLGVEAERAGMYRTRAERLERGTKAQMAGLQSEVRLVRRELGKVERDVLLGRLETATATEDREIAAQLHNVAKDAAQAQARLKALHSALHAPTELLA